MNRPLEPTPIPEQDFKLLPAGAVDKGALALNVVTFWTKSADADDRAPLPLLTALASQEVTIKIRTGGGGLSGGNLNSPYGTIYGPGGEFVAPLGDTAVRPRRSYNAPLTLEGRHVHASSSGRQKSTVMDWSATRPIRWQIEGDEPAPANRPRFREPAGRANAAIRSRTSFLSPDGATR